MPGVSGKGQSITHVAWLGDLFTMVMNLVGDLK